MFMISKMARRWTLACATLLSAVPIMIHAAPGAATNTPSSTLVFAPGAKLEKVFDGGFFLEGPTQGPDGRIYFSDITQTYKTEGAAGYVWAYDPVSTRTEIFLSPSGMANGLIFDSAGRLVIASGADFGSRMITRIDMQSRKATIIAGLYNGHRFNSPNDLAVDAEGRIYFTDPRYFGLEPLEQPVMGVYRIDPDGKISLILADVARPNGIAISPDQKSLYVSEANFLVTDFRNNPRALTRSGERTIRKYDLSPDGQPASPRIFVDFADKGDESADGIEVDSAGNLYAAIYSSHGPGVRVYSPSGKELAFLPVPSTATNLTIADVGCKHWLFITVGKSLYKIEISITRRSHSSTSANSAITGARLNKKSRQGVVCHK